MDKNLLGKSWHLISFNNLETHLVSGLRLNKLNRFFRNRKIKSTLITRQGNDYSHTHQIKDSFFSKKYPRLANALCIPDASLLWAFKVYRYLCKQPDGVILTTMPPYGLCIIGLLLKLWGSKHYWVADFRDPWTLNPVYQPVLYWYKKYFSRILERLVFRHADMILFNTDSDLQQHIKLHPSIRQKAIVIRNGFDEFVINKSRTKKPENAIRIVYSGSAYHRGEGALNILNFFEQINQYSHLPILCDYYGQYHPSLDFSPYVEYKGQIPHEQVPQMLSAYRLGFIYLQEVCIGGGRITQKFYDYIGGNLTPVVMNPSKEMVNCMDQLNFGIKVWPKFDPKEMAETIEYFYFSHQSSGPVDITPYSRNYQFELLMNHLKNQSDIYSKQIS